MHVGGVSHSVATAPRARAVKSSEFGGKVVSTLDGSIWSRYSIALTCPARSHFQRILSKERGGQGWDERYRSSREGGDEEGKRKQATDFEEAVCCPTAVVQGAA